MGISSDPRSLAGRPKDRARLLGQVLTPPQIAQHMAKVLLGDRPHGSISIVDPAVGPGTFPMALVESGFLQSSDELTVYDIDEEMITTTQAYLRSHRVIFRSICADSALRRMETDEAESYLTSLPGIGIKTARCILMYSLNREVFPADVHCYRIMERLGWLVWQGRTSRTIADFAQQCVPPHLRRNLHIRFVQHGRHICTSRVPKCGICILNNLCRKNLVSKAMI